MSFSEAPREAVADAIESRASNDGEVNATAVTDSGVLPGQQCAPAAVTGDADAGEAGGSDIEVEEACEEEGEPPIEIEEVHDEEQHASDLPYPTEYAFGDGNELVYSYTGQGCTRSKRVVYHSQVVHPEDTTALCMSIECDRTEKDLVLAVCRDDVQVVGSFAEFFSGGTTLKPVRGAIVRVCVCPLHAKVVMSSYLMDAIRCVVPLPRLLLPAPGDSPSDGAKCDAGGERSATGWRVVGENGDGFVRFFDVERSSSCYCNFPVLFST